VDADAGQQVGGLRREQGVVDADAVVPLPGAGLIVPEGIGAGRAVGLQEGVGQAQVLQRPERLTGLRAEEGIALAGRGEFSVARLGNDVEDNGLKQMLLHRRGDNGV